jgi:hypothetical protein
MRWGLLLSLIAVATLVRPQPAGALAENNLSGTYAFTVQATATDPTKLCNGAASCGGVNNVAGSLSQFYKQFGSDLSKKLCKNASSQLVSIAAKIAASGPKAGDSFFATGTIIADGFGGFTDGFATLTSNSLSGEFINYSNTGVQAEVCGGSDKSGDCSQLCTAGSLGCATQGGYGITGTGGTALLYLYPELPAGMCGPVQIEADLCCNDPSLVVTVHMSLLLENINASTNVAQNVKALVTDQAQAGTGAADLQP